MKDRNSTIKKLEAMAKRMRQNVLKMALTAGAKSSHFGGGLSIVDITATLYGEILNLDQFNPEWEGRDRFILSKGHAGASVYATLAECGFMPIEKFTTHY